MKEYQFKQFSNSAKKKWKVFIGVGHRASLNLLNRLGGHPDKIYDHSWTKLQFAHLCLNIIGLIDFSVLHIKIYWCQ